MNRIPGRAFTAQYKAEPVELAGAVGVPTAARQREIPTKSLYLWIKQSTEGKLKASGVSKRSAEQQRTGEPERELAIARTERDLLKKTAAFVRLRKPHDILCKRARKGKGTGASARCALRTGSRSLRPDSFITATVVASMAATPTKTHWQAMACVPP